MDGETVAYLYNGILLTSKEKIMECEGKFMELGIMTWNNPDPE